MFTKRKSNATSTEYIDNNQVKAFIGTREESDKLSALVTFTIPMPLPAVNDCTINPKDYAIEVTARVKYPNDGVDHAACITEAYKYMTENLDLALLAQGPIEQDFTVPATFVPCS